MRELKSIAMTYLLHCITAVLAVFCLSSFLPLSSVHAYTFTTTLQLGDQGAPVSALQQKLDQLGYYAYPSYTGFFGTITEASVMALQRAYQLEPVGIVGPKTRAILNETETTTAPHSVTLLESRHDGWRIGTNDPDVTTLQRQLQSLGFFTYPQFTTYFGTITAAALQAFQSANLLPPTGELDTRTRLTLSLAYAKQLLASLTNGRSEASPAQARQAVILSAEGSGQSESSSLVVPDQTIVFGALTLADAGDIVPTSTLGTITSATIQSGNESGHWQIAADGTLTPTAAGDTANLNEGPYTLNVRLNGGEDYAALTITTENNTYSVSNMTEALAAASAINTASDGARTIKLRTGSYGQNANFMKDRAYENRVTITPHSGATATFSNIDITNTDNVTLDGLTFYRASSSMLSVRGGSAEIIIENNTFSGPDIDPTGDYSAQQPTLTIGITKDGTTPPHNLTIRNNTLHDIVYPIGWSPMGATGFLTITGNYIYDFYEDGIKINYPAGNATTTIADNVLIGAIGNSADVDSPHIDYIQAVGVGDRDWTGLEILRNIIVNTYSRATAQGIFIDDMTGGYHFNGIKVNGNLVINTGGATTGIRVRQAEDAEIYGNTIVSQLLFAAAGPGIVIGDDITAGTHLVRNNVADVISIAGTTISENNQVAGIGGATIAYSTLFAGSTFSPTTRAAALSEFAMRANGPLDTDASGGASIGDIGAVGSGYVTFPASAPGGGGSLNTAYEADVTAPTISTLNPADNATEVNVTSNLVASFSETVSFDTTVIIGLYESNDTVVETWDEGDIGSGIAISGNTLTINPTSNLTASTSYYVQIGTTTIKDGADNYFAGITDETTWTFTTGNSSYVASAVRFDGSSDYLTRDADLTGISDGKEGLLSVWVNLQGGDGTFMNLLSQSTTTNGLTLERMNTNVWRLGGKDTAGSQRLRIDSLSTYTTSANSGWNHLLFAWNGLTGTAQLYINDADNLNTGNDLVQNVNLDLTQAEFAIGGWPDATRLLNAGVADLQFWTSYADISATSTRRNFIDATGKPVDPTVASSTYGTALIRLSNPTATWHINVGSGGGFTENGALTDAANSPSE